MNAEQKWIHEYALAAKVRYHKFELEFVQILKDVERSKTHKALDKSSVHAYAVGILGFTDAVAYSFIAVARKSREVPEILESGLSVFVLNRMVSTLKPENADELIRFAQTHSSRELERELGRRNPRSKCEKVKFISEECVEISAHVSGAFLEKLKRVEALRAQKSQPHGVGRALEAALEEYLRKHDPVQKAERAQRRQTKAQATKHEETQRNETQCDESSKQSAGVGLPEELCARRVVRRVPLTAAQRHAVFARDFGRCTNLGKDGKRCGSDQWIQVHHIVEVAKGGGNDPANLTTLCSFHHDQIHQLSLPMDERQAVG